MKILKLFFTRIWSLFYLLPCHYLGLSGRNEGLRGQCPQIGASRTMLQKDSIGQVMLAKVGNTQVYDNSLLLKQNVVIFINIFQDTT